MLKAILHARVSTPQQRANYSLETQLQAGRTYAASLRAEVVEVIASDFANVGDDRADINRIRDLVRTGAANAVIFYEIDRTTRGGVGEFLLLIDELQALGAEVHFAARQAKAGETPEEQLFDSMRAAFAQFEKGEIQRRLARGWRGKAERGQVVGHGNTNYGYQRIGERRDVRFDLHPVTAPVVAEIFARYTGTSGYMRMGIRAIVRELNERGERTPQEWLGVTHPGKKRPTGEWGHHVIYKMLRNPIYKGEMAVRRLKSMGYTKSKTGKRYIKVRPADPSARITITVPAIVSAEVWDAAQALLDAGRAASPRNRRREYLLARLIRCSCGCLLKGRTNERASGALYRYYTCHGHDPSRYAHPCALRLLRAEVVEALVWDWVHRCLLTPERVRYDADAAATEAQGVTSFDQERASITKRLAALDDEDARARRQARKGLISDDELAEARAEITQQRLDLQSALRTVNQRALAAQHAATQRAEVAELLETYQALVATATPAQRRIVLDTLAVRITVSQRDRDTHVLQVYSVFPFDAALDTLEYTRA